MNNTLEPRGNAYEMFVVSERSGNADASDRHGAPISVVRLPASRTLFGSVFVAEWLSKRWYEPASTQRGLVGHHVRVGSGIARPGSRRLPKLPAPSVSSRRHRRLGRRSLASPRVPVRSARGKPVTSTLAYLTPPSLHLTPSRYSWRHRVHARGRYRPVSSRCRPIA